MVWEKFGNSFFKSSGLTGNKMYNITYIDRSIPILVELILDSDSKIEITVGLLSIGQSLGSLGE